MQIAKRMNSIPFTPIRKIFEEANRREAAGETIIHLEMGRPDFDTPAHIKAAAIKAIEAGKVHYSSNYGLPELRAAIADKFKRDNNLDYDPATEIIVTVGATEAIFMAMMALLDPGDEALIPMPAFPAYSRCVYMADAKPVPVPAREANDFTPSVSDLQSQITSRTRLLVLTTPNNPTGAVYSAEVLEQIAALAVEKDLIVLSDEIYEKIIYDGQRHYSIAAYPGMRERTITVNGFSKSYSMTGWRLGYIGSSAELVAALIRIKQYATVCATTFSQWGAVEALNGPQDCVAEMVAEFDRRRRMVLERLAVMPAISFTRPQGAFYIFINTNGVGKPPQQIAAELLEKVKIAVVPWGDEHIRISYANSYQNLSKAMDALEAVLSEWCG
ncbi:MAG: pyridoxal phosphate-dependent aminotransferase [Desulfobacterales bacterium]|jgi:aspartate/methionine/tyrosine aminotransferase